MTRAVSPRIAEAELTHLDRRPVSFDRAADQHRRYESWLASHGCTIVHAPPAPDHPDGVFVEDTAIVLDEIAVIMRPGAESRRGEIESIAPALAGHRKLRAIEAPGTIDGGDVLRFGRTLYVGLSTRTNGAAVDQLRSIVKPFGYAAQGVRVEGLLHLKSAASTLSEEVILCNPACVDPKAFAGARTIFVDESESGAGNVLRLGEVLLASSSFPRTRAVLEREGFRVETIDYDELEKAEGGVTCCSLVIAPSTQHPALNIRHSALSALGVYPSVEA